MNLQSTMQRCLEQADVEAYREINAKAFPHHQQPATREEAEQQLHYARTLAAFLPLKARAYSHRWLDERGLPSGLPDELRPSADRLYPKVVAGVGISVNASSPILKPACAEIRKSMEHAVLELHGDGVDLNAPIVRQRMFEARERTLRGLFGLTADRGLKQE